LTRDVTPAEIEAGTAYEALHVPALFAQWPPRLLRAVDADAGEHVLDVACGTGVLARAATTFVAPGGAVAGLDASPGMLATAERLDPSIDWRLGDAGSLPWDDGNFDVVACQFGLMFFPDRIAALREMWRVLKPGGRLAVLVWDTLEKSDGFREEVALLEQMAGLEAANALRAPFVLGDTGELSALFENAGIPGASITTRQGSARYPNIRTMVDAELSGWLPVMGVELDEDLCEAILGRAEHKLALYRCEDGAVAFDTSAHLVIATR